MKKTTATLAATAAALAMTACVPTTGGSASDDSPSGTNRPTTSSATSDPVEEDALAGTSPSTSDEPTVEEPTTDDGLTDEILDFGETVTYDDGLSVTVSEPTQINPGEYAYPEVAEATQFTITIVNGSDAPFDPSFAYGSVQSSNVEAEEVFSDTLGGPPSTTVLPGRETTYKAAFATADPSDIVFQLAPTWDHEDTFWTNSN